jgi:cytochrome c oxidase cbb3-type subunit 3
MKSRLIWLVAGLIPFALWAQDHADPKAEKTAPAPAQAKGKGGGGGGGRGAGGGAGIPPAPTFGGGGAEPINDAMIARMNQILATPSELEKGRMSFENHCVGCHGPKGEGSRGPTLAQPRLPRASADADLLRIIQRGIPNTEMPAVRLKTGEAPYLAAFVRSLGKIPVEPIKGDAAKGAELFKTKGACMTCHTLAGQGMAIGPDLTEIGLRRSVAFLRESLVNPAAQVPQSFNPGNANTGLPANFLWVRVKTKDGKEIAGARVNENTYSIQLRDLTGALYSFRKSELAELHKDKGQSPMPVYAGLFTQAEMDDMIAYLVSLQGRPQA